MAQRRNPTQQLSKIDSVFNNLEHVVERTERLLTKIILALALVTLLVFEIILVGKLLFNGH